MSEQNNGQHNIDKLKSRIKSLERENLALHSEKEVYQSALRQNLNVMRNLFDDAGFGMLLIDFDGNIIRSNALFADLTGYSSQELFKINFYTLFEKKHLSVPENQPFLTETKTGRFFKKMYRKNGSYIFVKLSIAVSHDIHKKPKGIFVMVEDVTEKTKSEKIRTSLYNISKATNNTRDIKDLLGIIRESLNIIFDGSEIFLALYDEKSDTFTFPYSTSFHVNGNESWKNHPLSYQVYTTGKSRLLKKTEIELLTKQTKKELPVAWMAVPLKINATIIGVLSMENYESEDIFSNHDLHTLEFVSTHVAMAIERKRREENMKLEKAFFENLFQNSPEAIAIITPVGEINNINHEFTKMFGYSPEECNGKNISMLLPGKAYEAESAEFRVNTFNKCRQLIETVRKHKDGQPIEVSILSTPINIDRKTQLAYIIYRDISERKEAERRLNIAKEKAEESDRLKGSFLANMSHEIRTPLNAIVGFSSLLSSVRADDQEQRMKYIQQITSSSDQLVKLIDSIIDISKIESGQIEIRKDLFSMGSVLEEQYQLFHQKYTLKNHANITFIKDFEGLNGLQLYSDASWVQQVISILLDNAFKFTPSGKIVLGSKLNSDHITVYVKDEGIGISSNNLDKVFHRFVKVENDKNKLFRGTGIGLYIAKRILQYLDGEIWVESECGKGSTFYFKLPVDPSVSQQYKANEPEKRKGLHDKLILMVEDIPSNYVFLEAVLMNTGADLIWAKTGKEALDYVERSCPDLILMDIGLPDISGYEVTKRILDKNPGIPVIAQTAYASNEERQKCFDAGCIDYLAKPIREKDLRESVIRVFDGATKNRVLINKNF